MLKRRTIVAATSAALIAASLASLAQAQTSPVQPGTQIPGSTQQGSGTAIPGSTQQGVNSTPGIVILNPPPGVGPGPCPASGIGGAETPQCPPGTISSTPGAGSGSTMGGASSSTGSSGVLGPAPGASDGFNSRIGPGGAPCTPGSVANPC